MSKFVLRSSSRSHPDIDLKHGLSTTVGRGPATRIKDPRLSRSQLELIADVERRRVKAVVRGGNTTVIAGKKLAKGEAAIVFPGDAIELLEGQHYCTIEILDNSKSSTMSGKSTKDDGKRKGESAGKSSGHWSGGLLASMNDPNLKVEEDDLTVTIKDKYPKAKHHYLVLPKSNIPNLKSVTKEEHLTLLKHMHQKGLGLADKHEGSEFKLGYHAIPSMAQLHLHVISQDFDSPCLKTKKHWNSFTTDYFVPSLQVLEEVEKTGKPRAVDKEKSKELLNLPLKCHKCSCSPKNMPDLKKHLKEKHL